MKKQYGVWIGCGVILVLIFASQGWTQSKRPLPENPGLERGNPKIAPPPIRPQNAEPDDEGSRINWRMLNLTAEQREQIQQLRRKFQIDTAGIRTELQFSEQDLRAEMFKGSLDRAKIDELVQQTADLKRRLSEAAVQNLLAIKELLTADQRQTLADFQQPMPAELRAVSLTSEQRSQIRALLQASKQKNHELSGRLDELKDELRTMIFSVNDVDPKRLQQVQTEIGEQELALEKNRVENILAIQDVLTPNQRKMLRKSQSNRPKEPSLPR